MEGGEAVERAVLAAVGGGLAREAVPFRNEQILDRVVVATGPLEADHAPDVVDARARLGNQHGALGRLAVGAEPRRAVALEHGQWQPSQVACLMPLAKNCFDAR